MTDNVNHPKHYTSHPSGVECVTIAEHYSFCIGNAMKYLFRAGLKTDDPIEDLQKAAWYVQREIVRLTPTLEEFVDQVNGEAKRLAAETETPPQYVQREPRVWEFLRHVPENVTVTDDNDLLWRHFAVDGWISNPGGNEPKMRYSTDEGFADLRGPYTEVL